MYKVEDIRKWAAHKDNQAFSRDVVLALLKAYDELEVEKNEYKKAAESWMADYDKLKAKYEPTYAVPSETI